MDHRWKLAMRVLRDAEGPRRLLKGHLRKAGIKIGAHEDRETPAVMLDSTTEEAYYMLNQFNHHHQQ
jgi:hypothetical protein